jgi:EAL domain-containing protein (putative c-di-GMP-specific phosphodiesterase class I)
VAEGIETPAELTTVRELGVDSAQGFYLGRPAPAPLDELLAAAAATGGNGVRARRPSASA